MSELPKGWTETTLAIVGVWRGGGTPSKSVDAYWRDGNIPWVSPKDMKSEWIDDSEDHISQGAIEGSATQLIDTGSVLVVTRSGILRHSLPVGVNTRDVAINQDLKALTPYTGVDPRFVAYQLRAFAQSILGEAAKKGTTVESVEFEKLKAFRFLLPPAAEQRRIVAKLDAMLAGVARARKELDRVPILIAHHKQALLAAAFSGELTREWREQQSTATPVEPRRPGELKKKFAADEDDDFAPPYEVPESWRWLRLPELGSLDRGKSKHRPRNDKRLFGGSYPFIQTGEVRAADRYLRDYSQT